MVSARSGIVGRKRVVRETARKIRSEICPVNSIADRPEIPDLNAATGVWQWPPWIPCASCQHKKRRATPWSTATGRAGRKSCPDFSFDKAGAPEIEFRHRRPRHPAEDRGRHSEREPISRRSAIQKFLLQGLPTMKSLIGDPVPPTK